MKNVIILAAILFLTSCEVDVTDEISLETTIKLVVEGGLERNSENPLESQKIRLTTTANFLDGEENIPIVENALVQVSDGIFDYDFNYTGDGIYENIILEPQLNTTYTITITWNGESYQGSDILTKVPVFDDFYFVFEEETLFTDEGYVVKFDSTDPPGIENYYYNRVFRNGEFIIVPDPGNNTSLVLSDQFFDGQSRVAVNPNEEVIFEVGEVATAQQLSISENYYDYLYEVFTQTSGGGLNLVGNPPPESIRGNLINTSNPANRPLGFFYTVDVEEDSITITE